MLHMLPEMTGVCPQGPSARAEWVALPKLFIKMTWG